jgi:hypothetical protein
MLLYSGVTGVVIRDLPRVYQTTDAQALPGTLPLEEGGLSGSARLARPPSGEHSDANLALPLHEAASPRVSGTWG